MEKPAVLTVTLNPSLDKTIILEQFKIGGLNRTQLVRLDPGGKGINVARLLNNFGIPVRATGWCGGPEGAELIQYLREAGIDEDFVKIEGRTRINLKIVDSSTQITTEVNEPGSSVGSLELEQFKEKLRISLKDVSYLVLGGSLPPEVPVSIYSEMIHIAKELGIRTILDADGIALQEGLKAIPYAIKPNIHELEQLLDKKLSTDEEILGAARDIIHTGVSLVIVSMGEKGSIVVNEHEGYQVKPFSIKPKSTVGAGDSMVAGLVYSLIHGKTLQEMAAWTTASGTLTASKEGTQMCTLEEVKEHVHRVQIREI